MYAAVDRLASDSLMLGKRSTHGLRSLSVATGPLPNSSLAFAMSCCISRSFSHVQSIRLGSRLGSGPKLKN